MKKLVVFMGCLSVILYFCLTNSYAGDWVQIGKSGEKLYAAGDNRFYISRTGSGDIYLYGGTPYNWTRICEKGHDFVIYQSELIRLSFDKTMVDLIAYFPTSEFTGKWKAIKIRGKTGRIYGGPFGLFATDPDKTDPKTGKVITGNIYKYEGKPNAWKKIGGPGRTFAVGKNRLYGLSTDGSLVLQYDGTKWVPLGKQAGVTFDIIYAGGNKLYATYHENPKKTGPIYQYDHQKGLWTEAGGPGKMFTVDDEGRLYGLSTEGAPNEGVWFHWGPDPKDWMRIGEPAGRIVAAGNQLLYATNPQTKDVLHFIPKGDLEVVDWCYYFPKVDMAEDIGFSLIIKNVGKFVWNTQNTGWYTIVIAYNDGVHCEYRPVANLNPTGLNPGEQRKLSGLGFTLPFSLTWKYYVGALKISHPDDKNNKNDLFIPPKEVTDYGIKGDRFWKGGDMWKTKKCDTP